MGNLLLSLLVPLKSPTPVPNELAKMGTRPLTHLPGVNLKKKILKTHRHQVKKILKIRNFAIRNKYFLSFPFFPLFSII